MNREMQQLRLLNQNVSAMEEQKQELED